MNERLSDFMGSNQDLTMQVVQLEKHTARINKLERESAKQWQMDNMSDILKNTIDKFEYRQFKEEITNQFKNIEKTN